jgi:arylsulfatase A-like enzyme
VTGRSRRSLLVWLLLVAVLIPSASVEAAKPKAKRLAGDRPPDIVVLMIDDLPQIDDRIWERLPTIKRLFLDEGVRFTQYFGNDPLCCPGRANVLTGQWSHHHGVTTNDARLFDPRVTLATELRQQGYWTGIFGKYFNQALKLADRTPPGWSRSFLTEGAYFDYTAMVDGRLVRFGSKPNDYSTAQIRQRSIRALREIPARWRPRFLWLAPFAVHGGWDEDRNRRVFSVAAPRDRGATACAGIEPWTTAAVKEADRSDKPAFIQSHRRGPGSMVPRCESLLSVDRMLKAVLAEFKAQGRPEPLVILTADNGMAWGAHGWYDKRVPYATPIPLFVSWPSVLGRAGRRVDTTVTNVDIAPTICAIAGCVMGPFPNGYGVDGLSFLPVLLGSQSTMGRALLFEEHNSTGDTGGIVPWKGVRTTEEAAVGQWVYTEYRSGEKELYDVSGGPCWNWKAGDPGDPCQLTNLAGHQDHAVIQARLAETLSERESHPLSVLRRPR